MTTTNLNWGGTVAWKFEYRKEKNFQNSWIRNTLAKMVTAWVDEDFYKTSSSWQ